MTALRDRKTRLTFSTDQTIRYRGKHREIIVEPAPCFCRLRLKGTRVAYEASWETIYVKGAAIFADRQRQEKREARKRGRR